MNDPILNPQAQPSDHNPLAEAPTARVKKRAPISWVWLVPLAAAAVALYVAALNDADLAVRAPPTWR